MYCTIRAVPALTAICCALLVHASPEAPPLEYKPPVAKASDEAEKAIARFKRDKALRVEVWAAEPLLANPVAFAFDEKGRCFVAETFRLHRGVTDNRGHMNWLDEELAARSVADRIALYKRDVKAKFAETYEKDRDRVRMVEDTKGSGKADRSTVFCDDFGRAEDGIGSGVLARHGNVYFTCIPDLWLLKDTKGAGRADVKQSLSTGYGPHVSFIGHDSHGLRMGPEGKLYFSIGDRGLNVTSKEGKKLFYPDTGAVLRCDPDGSNLEAVHIGLRNPQELAFDDYGNLFTIDNNSDAGDQARWIHIAEGGDSGWRIGYQYGSAMGDRGPWKAEKLWHTRHEGQPAYILPPLRHFTSGPSGFCYYPGVGLSQRYNGHFFICDFRGNSGGSGIWSFTTKPKGASFEMTDDHQFVWSILATDCDFGPDGAFYISDWVEGWGLTGKGRIYKVSDPEAMKNPAVAEAKTLLAEGFDKRSTEELIKLLAHPHQQVRLEAQYAIAAKGKEAIEPLAKTAKESKERLARIHAIWGLGMIGRKEPGVREPLVGLLKDQDDEVRAQAARVFGWFSGGKAADLQPLLQDAQPRVRFQALTSLANERVTFADGDAQKVWGALVALLKENADKDLYIRHAVSLVMARYSGQELVSASSHESTLVRIASVLALRHRASPVVWPFLDDADPNVAAEAARVLHDVVQEPTAGTPLAERLNRPGQQEGFVYRALNANFRLGEPNNAKAVAEYAANPSAPEALRILALKMLGEWAKPSRRDHVTGLTQSLRPRDAKPAVDALVPVIGKVFSGSAKIRQEAAGVAAKLGIKEVGPFLFTLVGDDKQPASARSEALRALEALKDSRLGEATEKALAANDPRLRNAARAILLKTKSDEVLTQLVAVLDKHDIAERQGAFALLAAMKTPAADQVLSQWLTRLLDGQVPPEIVLDLLDAARERAKVSKDPLKLNEKLSQYDAARPKGDDLANYRETLVGGDAENGRRLFYSHAAASCQRCHKIDGQGGDVGPPLNGLGAKQKRDYLLASLVLPNKDIAKGFDSVIVTMLDGKSVSGVLRAEDAKQVTIITAEAKVITVPKADIDERRPAKSAMPEDLATKLTKSEIRDLVEFLAGLKDEMKK